MYRSGADNIYVGTEQQSGAAMDRFVAGPTITLDYCEKLEKTLARAIFQAADKSTSDADAFVSTVWKVRGKVRSNKVRRIVSTRAIVNGSKLIGFCGESAEGAIREIALAWTDHERSVCGIK